MLDALLRAQVIPEHIVLSSSRAVYGEGEWITRSGVTFSPGPRTHAAFLAGQWNPVGPDGEVATPRPSVAGRTSPHPTSIYGATKLTQELVLSAWSAATGAPLSTLRFQNVYGPGQSLRTRTPASSRFSLRWLSGVMSWCIRRRPKSRGLRLHPGRGRFDNGRPVSSSRTSRMSTSVRGRRSRSTMLLGPMRESSVLQNPW